jgi:hypothetical protein
LLKLAETYASVHGCTLGVAVVKISTDHPALTAGYGDEVGANVTRPVEAPVISLRSDADGIEEFVSLANTVAKERGIALSEAAKEAGRQRPDLAAAWSRG